jgi:protoporphyrin/coproporphyrin ferrochelatase
LHPINDLKHLENTATTGILLVNLGTPDSPATGDVRRYLIEFLTDPRVIDIPPIQRQLLVRGIIGPFRAPKSAKSYREIWTAAGSPLLLNSQSQREGVAKLLGPGYQVELAMRYQNPSIASVLERFKGKRLKKLRVIPLFPQYASASTGSVHAEVMRIVSQWQVIPDIEFVNSYPTHPGMIAAFADLGGQMQPQSYDHILFSFHGLPERQLIKADAHNHCLKSASCCDVLGDHNHYCYSAQCHATAQAIAAALDIPRDRYTVTYQSRLGRTPWKRPYTSDVLKEMAETGKKRLLAFSPAFTSDCLETIFEIGEEYQEDFQKWGGEKLDLVPGLNDHPIWIQALADICK